VDAKIYGGSIDTDGDGIPDPWEIANGLNPNDPSDAVLDGDSDGLDNLGEYQNGTDITLWDTDGDSMPDGWEVQYGLDPLNPLDAANDPDGDGLTNLDEYQQGTDPTVPENATYSDLVLLSNPSIYLSLDESSGALVAVDSSGNLNSGSYVNGVGLNGSHASFDGVDDRIDLPNGIGINNAPRTIEFYVYKATIPTIQHQSVYWHGNWESGDVGHGLQFLTDGRFVLSAWNTSTDMIAVDYTPYLGAWTHVAATWDGITRKLYLNGVLIGTSNAPMNNVDSQHFLGRFDMRSNRIGAQDPFDGLVDDFAFYDSALDQVTIQSHYAAGGVH